MLDKKVIGGTLLIAGTTIGAGMLALPMVTGATGFIGTIIIFTACWLMMLWTAFLVLEVNLSFPGELNLISMARNTLGKNGARLTWLCYLFLLYALLSAYLSGGGAILTHSAQAMGFSLPTSSGTFAFLALFGLWGIAGIVWVDRANSLLMILMLGAYLYLADILASNVNPANLLHFSANGLLLSLSIVITAFGFHVIIPSISTYLDRDVSRIKTCIIAGCTIPYFVYLIWEFLILGTVPLQGVNGIIDAEMRNFTLSTLLTKHISSQGLHIAIELFSISAIVTSFLGISQSLMDFLRDGFGIKSRSVKARSFAFCLAIAPPLFFSLMAQKGFILALEYAGVFVALLTGILPIFMVRQARKKGLSSLYYAPFNSALAVGGTLFFMAIIVVVISHNFGVF